MATVHVAVVRSSVRYINTALPVPDSVEIAANTMTSSGSSAQSGATTNEAESIWSITSSGGNVYAKFGANPTAAADAGFLILDGQTRFFAYSGVDGAVEKVAIKDA